MAAHYVEIMTDILAEFDNYSHDNKEYYTALAWIGSLQKTSSYERLSEEIKTELENYAIIEYFNGSKSCIN
jgi:hypothetical protein